MALLGDDGRGYELARKLETHGIWRSWLGDSLYTNFIHFLSSPSTWDSFMTTNDSKTRVQIQLQLRARALLFDKASIALFLRSDKSPSSTAISKLNPNYLQLHGDDVYFTLENCSQDGAQQCEGVSDLRCKPPFHPPCPNTMCDIVINLSIPLDDRPEVQSKSNFGVGSRYSETEADTMSQRLNDLPETWYNQFFEKYRASKSYRLQFGDREAEKRTPEQMSFYLRVVENHKRRRVAFKVDQNIGYGMLDDGSNLQANSGLDNDNPFFPETMSAMNCVPDSAVLRRSQLKENQKVEFNGILDTLPQIMTKSPSAIMIERLGIRSEYLSMDQGSNQNLGKSGAERTKKCLGEEQALKLSQKVMAQLLENVGFEGSSEVPLEVLTKFMSCHIRKLGATLKLLADSYRKQCSAMELLKMFLHTDGHSLRPEYDLDEIGAVLSALVKDNTRNVVQQTQQQVQGIQQQLQPQHAAAIRQSQQGYLAPGLWSSVGKSATCVGQAHDKEEPRVPKPWALVAAVGEEGGEPRVPKPWSLVAAVGGGVVRERLNGRGFAMSGEGGDFWGLRRGEGGDFWGLRRGRRDGEILRMHPQMQQMINSGNLTPQQLQQLERMRRRQQLTPRPGMGIMNIDKERPLVEVKLEHPTDFPMDNNAFNAMTARQPQMQQQFRQQQIAPMSSAYAQNTNQFRPMSSLQIPQVQSPNMGMARAPPVKVEGFQELMGGDATMKHDSEENKLMSPQK
ncbi:hypothetical protein RND71_028572 [Anisodus tanguticus]|uniref:Bromodomain associated domain-containing protein n=1 Tax=Anisodus tanguticus TaxID=243964 RepID=A0AAE1RIN9_9SOLA|nr:hypothetical protein RND71_028572 [Anisodus tanguticus]